MMIPSLVLALTVWPATNPDPDRGAKPHTTWIDADADGLPDLLACRPEARVQLLLNLGDGTFGDGTPEAGLSGLTGALRARVSDYDGDGNEDVLFVLGDGVALYRSTGQGGFTPIIGEPPALDGVAIQDARWSDFDGDGSVDLELHSQEGIHFYRNTGRGGFEIIEQTGSGVQPPSIQALGGRIAPLPTATRPGPGSAAHRSAARGLARTEQPYPETGGSGARSLGAQRSQHGPSCSHGITDAAGVAGCIRASTTPALGLLTPLSSLWSIDATSGNMGIGNTDPTTQLDVNGVVRSGSGGFRFPDDTTLSSAIIGPPGVSLWNESAGDLSYSAGFVGIGTSTPEQQLHIREGDLHITRGSLTSDYTASLSTRGNRNNSNNFGVLRFRNYDESGSAAEYTAASIWGVRGPTSDSAQLSMRTNDGTGSARRLSIDEHGNTRVDGDVTLTRAGATVVNRIFEAVGQESTGAAPYSALEFTNRDDSSGGAYVGAKIEAWAEGSEDGLLTFSTNDGGGAIERMRIRSDGKIGVGVSDPTTRLDVDGIVRSRSGGFRFPNGSLQTKAIFTGNQTLTLGLGDFRSNQERDPVNSTSNGVFVDVVAGTPLLASIHLPGRARIHQLTVHVFDTDVASDLTVTLGRKDLASLSYTSLATLNTGGSNTGYHSATVGVAVDVDNSLGNYFVRVAPSGSWPGDSSLAIQGISIEWTLQ